MLDESPPAISDEPFRIGDVLGDALASFRRTLGAHMKWNAMFIALAFLAGCGSTCLMVPVFAAFPMSTESSPTNAVLAIVALYAVLLLVFMVLFALHQGVTHELTSADLRSQPIELGGALQRATRRLPSVAGTTFLRVLADLLVGGAAIGALTAATIMTRASPTPSAADVPPLLLFALPFLYLAYVAWIFVVRAFLGLSGVAAQLEELGPFAAVRRSLRLLDGRRWQMFAMRVLWAFAAIALYVVTYLPILGIVMVSGADGARATALLILPYAFVWYYFALHMLTFDSVLEGAFYARVVRRETAESIAEVFA